MKFVSGAKRLNEEEKSVKYEGETRLIDLGRAGAPRVRRPVFAAWSFEAGIVIMLRFPWLPGCAHVVHTRRFPACQRLEIRNGSKCRQEKFGSLFSFAAQKNLDENLELARASGV